MQRAEYLVARQGGSDGDLCRFRVSDFADHHHIRVLAQDRPESVCEMEVTTRTNRDLSDPGQFVFDGILDGQDLFFGRVDPLKNGVKSGRFPAASRPGRQKKTVWL